MSTIPSKPVIFWGILLVVLVVLGNWLKPGETPPVPLNPKAAEALDLVKKHPARQARTLEEAIGKVVADLERRGIPNHVGEWRVGAEGPDTYVVSVLIREKGSVEWIERDYAWRINLKDKSLRFVTLPASSLLPFHELPPLLHQSDIS